MSAAAIIIIAIAASGVVMMRFRKRWLAKKLAAGSTTPKVPTAVHVDDGFPSELRHAEAFIAQHPISKEN